MSVEFDNKFIEFNRWHKNHRFGNRDIPNDVKFLQDAFDKAIELLECANKDLRAYEKGTKSSGLLI